METTNYASLALQATKLELQVLDYKIKSLNVDDLLVPLKAQSEIFSRDKNTKIEILDHVPCHAVISVAGRIAPLMLEF